MSAEQPLSAAAYQILLALADEDRHGYAIMQEATASGLRMGPGTLYGAIRRLLQDGLIHEARPPEPEVDERRRYYRLTEPGRGALYVETTRLAGLVQRAVSRGVLPAPGMDSAS